ncbi:hypothetical protein J437_LFUL015833, partial [Ladona fulva]
MGINRGLGSHHSNLLFSCQHLRQTSPHLEHVTVQKQFFNMCEHFWEPLAHIHLSLSGLPLEENIYCLCSRVFIRDAGSIREGMCENSTSIDEKGNHYQEALHSVESKENVQYYSCVAESQLSKSGKNDDENVSCYCSASHTDNNYSTDEYVGEEDGDMRDVAEPEVAMEGLEMEEEEEEEENELADEEDAVPEEDEEEQVEEDPHADIHGSDSGADLSEGGGCCVECSNAEELPETRPENQSKGQELLQGWERFWSQNGEQLIWHSWLQRYGHYINPGYLSINEGSAECEVEAGAESMAPESKDDIDKETDEYVAYSPFQNPSYDKDTNDPEPKVDQSGKSCQMLSTGDDVTAERRSTRSVSAGTSSSSSSACSSSSASSSPSDSITTVTQITVSSLGQDELPDEEDDGASAKSPSQMSEGSCTTGSECDAGGQSSVDNGDAYWQELWRQHFEERYYFHYNEFLSSRTSKISEQSDTFMAQSLLSLKNVGGDEGCSSYVDSFVSVSLCDDDSQEIAALDDKGLNMPVAHKRSRSRSSRVSAGQRKLLDSVGALLKTLHVSVCEDSVCQDGEGSSGDQQRVADTEIGSTSEAAADSSFNPNLNARNGTGADDGDDEPPEERSITLKR